MEEKIFPQPAVAGVLTRHYVEARLHTDHPEVPIQERNRALQDELQGSRATPHYILIDPTTRESLDSYAGATFDPDEFRDFLLGGVDLAVRPERVAGR